MKFPSNYSVLHFLCHPISQILHAPLFHETYVSCIFYFILLYFQPKKPRRQVELGGKNNDCNYKHYK